jgi:hypothetical protein
VPIISDYIEAVVANTEVMMDRLFKSGPGVPVGIDLKSAAEMDPPDAPISGQIPQSDGPGRASASNIREGTLCCIVRDLPRSLAAIRRVAVSHGRPNLAGHGLPTFIPCPGACSLHWRMAVQ